MANQVTLTFAGETKNVEDAFSRVGSSSEEMSRRVGDSSDGFDRVGEAADGAEGKAQGFSDTLTGVKDIASGTGDIMKGNLFDGFVAVGTGAADLAGGMASFLVPALSKAKVAMLALNLSFLTSPITWIVLGIVLLIAVIVLIATKTDWFQRAWKAAWGWIKSAASNVWDWIKKIPGWIGDAFKKIAEYITWPFRTAFNYISDAWNNTIGKLSWSVPDWIPFIGGKTISVPNLPKFHSGGIMPGAPGSEGLAILQAGERISTRGDGGPATIIIKGDGTAMAEVLIGVLGKAIRNAGGDVQEVLGGSRG